MAASVPHVVRLNSHDVPKDSSQQTMNMSQRLHFMNRNLRFDEIVKSVIQLLRVSFFYVDNISLLHFKQEIYLILCAMLQ
jgi:hypothetical protein